MAKYLLKVSYSAEGLQGVRKEGAAARAAFIGQLLETVGGTLESFYFAFGPDDVILIVDLPDNKTAMAIAATVGASEAISAFETSEPMSTRCMRICQKQSSTRCCMVMTCVDDTR